MAPTLSPVLLSYSEKGYPLDTEKLKETLAELASYHAKFKQGFEVAWALRIGKLLKLILPDSVWSEICSVDDPIVALLSLDLRAAGLADSLDPALWAQHMTQNHLYSENWLVAYEALRKGWLPAVDGGDYAANDDFFGVLSKWNVQFYDVANEDAASNLD